MRIKNVLSSQLGVKTCFLFITLTSLGFWGLERHTDKLWSSWEDNKINFSNLSNNALTQKLEAVAGVVCIGRKDKWFASYLWFLAFLYAGFIYCKIGSNKNHLGLFFNKAKIGCYMIFIYVLVSSIGDICVRLYIDDMAYLFFVNIKKRFSVYNTAFSLDSDLIRRVFHELDWLQSSGRSDNLFTFCSVLGGLLLCFCLHFLVKRHVDNASKA